MKWHIRASVNYPGSWQVWHDSWMVKRNLYFKTWLQGKEYVIIETHKTRTLKYCLGVLVVCALLTLCYCAATR